MLKSYSHNQDNNLWDIIITLRLYVIVTFFMIPVVHLLLIIKYFQTVSIIILGFSTWLIIKFVLFEPRTASKRFLKISLSLLIPAAIIIFINFLSGLIINITHNNEVGILFSLSVFIISIAYFLFMIIVRPLMKINMYLTSKKLRWESKGSCILLRRNLLEVVLLFWTLVSFILLFVPFRTYIQKPHLKCDARKTNRIGFWTGGRYFDRNLAEPSRYVSDEMLDKFGNAGIYLIYSGIRHKSIGDNLVEDLTRCKKYGVEVNISVSSMIKGDTFVNIWTFERLEEQIEEVLSFLKSHNLLGNPVTTLVYDMEGLTDRKFPLYGKDPAVIGKIPEYYTVQKKFNEFNRHVIEEYKLKIRICTETMQAIDFRDGDDDLNVINGVMSDEKALMSYMIYRRNDFALNFVLDHLRFLKGGETIILNSWKFEGYMCWNDLECAVEEARLVLGYPQKHFGLEIYALCYFIDSYGLDGLFKFIDAVNMNQRNWQAIKVRNKLPYSALWEVISVGISVMDIYGPFFRVASTITK